MTFKEYEGLSVEKAVEKLRSKSFHDEEDKAFARARASLLSPEELSAITGDDLPEAEEKEEDIAGDGNKSDDDKSPEGDGTPEGFITEKEMAKLTSDELQAIAVEKGLDTSGTKKELTARINAFLTEVK